VKKILLLIAVSISCHCQAQDTLFTIISVKGKVTLDGISVSCGQIVDSRSQLLIVQDKKSYISVLTESGFAFQLGKGKHKTKSIAEQEISNLERLNLMNAGAVNYSISQDIVIMGPRHEYKHFTGDSLTFIWRSLRKEKTDTFNIKLLNIFEEPLMEKIVYSNIFVLPIKNLRDSDSYFVIQIYSKKLRPRSAMIKSLNRKEKLEFEFDVSCIKPEDFIQQKLLLAGLYEIYNLYWD